MVFCPIVFQRIFPGRTLVSKVNTLNKKTSPKLLVSLQKRKKIVENSVSLLLFVLTCADGKVAQLESETCGSQPSPACFPRLASPSGLITVQQAGMSAAVAPMMKGWRETRRKGTEREAGARGGGGACEGMGDGTVASRSRGAPNGAGIVGAHNNPCVYCVVDTHWLPMLRTMSLWERMKQWDQST